MYISDEELRELKRAYQVLGVPPEASAHSIKHAYRRMVKRWHPDLSVAGTAAHAEATRMTKTINGAFAAIAHAPLRYHVGTGSRGGGTPQADSTASGDKPKRAGTQGVPMTDRLEFWVRFASGALVGIFASFYLAVSGMPDSSSNKPMVALSVLGLLGVVLGFGFGAARYGDKFWYWVFRGWWLWP